MDIVILSASVGGGRRHVSGAIESYLSSAYRGELDFESVDFFERFVPELHVLGRFAYQQRVGFFPSGRGTLAGLASSLPDDPVIAALERQGLAQAEAYLADRRPEAVVALHPVAGGVAAELKGRLTPESTKGPFCCLVLDGWAPTRSWMHPDTDLYFAASQDVKDALVAQGMPWASVQVTGVPLASQFDALPTKESARERHGLDDRFTALVLGWTLGPDAAHEIVAGLASEGVQAVVVAGAGGKVLARVRGLSSRRGVTVIGWTDDMVGIMRAADVAIAGPSAVSMAEALACGLPQVLTGTVPAAELPDVDFLIDHGAALGAPDAARACAKALFLATHPQRLAELGANATRLSLTQATKQLCDRVAHEVRRRRETVR